MREQLAKVHALAKLPHDQFGNVLPGQPPQVGGGYGDGVNAHIEHISGHAMGVMSPPHPSERRGRKGGVAARGVKEEGVPAVVSHDEYKAEIEKQIAEKKRQVEEKRLKEGEEDRRDNERLQRQVCVCVIVCVGVCVCVCEKRRRISGIMSASNGRCVCVCVCVCA